MNKIRNFLYDKNDIIVALIILIIAGLILVWRVDAIMAYPATLVSDQAEKVEKTESEVPEENTSDTPTSPAVAADSGEDDEPDVCGIYVNYGDSLETVAANCVNAGLIGSTEEFMQALNSKGAAVGIQAGQHHIPVGVTPDELIDYLLQPGI